VGELMASGAAGRRESGGFTLIEVLVVVCIVATIAAVGASIALPGDGARAEREARRLAVLLERAYAESRAGGRTIAWAPDVDGYVFWRRDDDGRWARFPDTSVYGGRSFEGATTLRDVRVASRPLAPGARVVLVPYGLHDPIELTIAGGSTRVAVRSNVLGRISLQRESD
jgi:general secretion pathway protein H